MERPCPICEARGANESITLYDDRHGFPGFFDLLSCHACEHRWVDWQPDAEVLGCLYSDYYPRSSRSTDDLHPLKSGKFLSGWWRGQHASASLWVSRNVRVLDIGCGFGESLAYHRARGCEVRGVEADRNISRIAARYGFDVEVGLFDASAYAPGSFDVVTMDQVIEHMLDPLETLRGVTQVLRPGGQLILTTPNARGIGQAIFRQRWIHWHAPYHLHFFSQRSMRMAAARTGLRVDGLTTITSSEWLKYQWIHLATRPHPGTKSAFWNPDVKRTSWQKATIWALAALHRSGANHALTRTFDLFNAGDNYVVRLTRPPD